MLPCVSLLALDRVTLALITFALVAAPGCGSFDQSVGGLDEESSEGTSSYETGSVEGLSEEDFKQSWLDASCGEIAGCGCPDLGYSEALVECHAEAWVGVGSLIATGLLEGLQYDPLCAEEVVAFKQTHKCGPTSLQEDRDWRWGLPRCHVYRGDLGLGDACEDAGSAGSTNPFAFLDRCGEGLNCSSGGTCVSDPSFPTTAAVGETCVFEYTQEDGLGNVAMALCAAGSYCDGFEGSNTCMPIPGPGEACNAYGSPHACGEGYECRFVEDGDVCTPKRGLGEACDNESDCESWSCVNSSEVAPEHTGVCSDLAPICTWP